MSGSGGEGELVAGVDVGNGTTEVAIALLVPTDGDAADSLARLAGSAAGRLAKRHPLPEHLSLPTFMAIA